MSNVIGMLDWKIQKIMKTKVKNAGQRIVNNPKKFKRLLEDLNRK